MKFTYLLENLPVMDTEAYERALRALREQEYNEVYKVNLCYVCSNALERPCFLCHNIRYTQKAVCLECLEVEGYSTGEEGGKPCVNCTRVIDRPCVMCGIIKHITVPACLRCCGELSEGEDDREDNYYGVMREGNKILLNENEFKVGMLVHLFNSGAFNDFDVEAWFNYIDIINVTIHYEWENTTMNTQEDGTVSEKVLMTLPYPRTVCKACNGECVCYDPDEYAWEGTDYTSM